MSLRDWRQFGWLQEHESSREEIEDLLSVVDRDLAACETPGLVADWRFNIAYNAVLQIASAALAASGHKAGRSAHHYRVIQSLAFTVETDAVTLQKLDVFRKKRNVSDYERADNVSELEVEEVRRIARKLRAEFNAWLARNHRHLRP